MVTSEVDVSIHIDMSMKVPDYNLLIQFENLSFRPRPIAHVVLDLGDNVLARDAFVRETVRIARDGTRPRLGPARSGLLRRTLTLVDRAAVSFALPQ